MSVSTPQSEPMVRSVSSSVREPAASPYAAPESDPQESSRFLPEGVSYRVVADVLYCRNNADLSNVCWMTGNVRDLARARCLIWPLGIMPLLALIASPVLSLIVLWTLARLPGTPFAASPISALVISAGAGMFIYSLLNSLKKNFRLHYGQSAAAVRSERREVASRWLSRGWTAMCIAGLLLHPSRDFLQLNASQQALLSVNLLLCVIVWGSGALAIHMTLRPRFFRPQVEHVQEGVFRLQGLTPEFLHSVSRISQPSAGTSAPSEG